MPTAPAGARRRGRERRRPGLGPRAGAGADAAAALSWQRGATRGAAWAVLDIDDPEVDSLAQQLATRTGETVAEAVKQALRERLARTPVRPSPEEIEERRRRIRAYAEEYRSLPVIDPRSPDEILGYDEHGLPT